MGGTPRRSAVAARPPSSPVFSDVAHERVEHGKIVLPVSGLYCGLEQLVEPSATDDALHVQSGPTHSNFKVAAGSRSHRARIG